MVTNSGQRRTDALLSKLAPEDELCLLLARGHLPADVQSRARELLTSSLRWDLLLERARDHEVFPLLYRSLRALVSHEVPSNVRAELAADFRRNALRNAFLATELTKVLRVLGEAGVRVIPLKGVTLAESLYGDPAFRVCWDLDILVPATEVVRARRLILAHGYTSPFSEKFFVNHQLRTSADCPLIPQVQREALSYLLELHWTLLQHSSRDADAMRNLWSEARPEVFFSVPAYSLSPEWEFLYLAAHAAYHKWQILKWLADIHELCTSTEIDWQKVREMAERFELDLAAGPTLAACSLLFGTPMPPGFASAALPPGVQLFPASLAPSESWKAPLFQPRLLKRRSEKLRWLAEMFFVARVADRRFLPLPARLGFLYYFLRPLRLTCKWSWLFLSAGFRRLRQRLP